MLASQLCTAMCVGPLAADGTMPGCSRSGTLLASHEPPPTLVAHVRKNLRAALPDDAPDGVVPRLVAELVALVPPGCSQNVWIHTMGHKVARCLSKNEALVDSVTRGAMGVADVLAADEEHARTAERAFEVITARHRALRQSHASGDDELVAAEWGDQGALGAYADAAAVIGSRAWVRSGSDWCAEQARTFFHRGGDAKFARKEAAAAWYRAESAELPERLRARGGEAAASAAAPESAAPIRLLDVGSCGSLFDGYDGIDVTPIDLRPNGDRVLQCDFLQLEVCTSAEISPRFWHRRHAPHDRRRGNRSV